MPSEPVEPPTRLSVRRGLAQDETLYEGVPDHLRPALARWASYWLGAIPEPSPEYELDETYRLFGNSPRERERRLGEELAAAHVRVVPEEKSWHFDDAALMIHEPGVGWSGYNRDNDFLELVDMHLQLHGGGAEKLTELLMTGGSAWTVGSSRRLERRVLDEQRHAFEEAVSPADSASDLLRKAWTKAYGRHPDPTGAWADAVRAVEVLMKPIVSPQDEVATLGKMIPALVDAPRKWKVTLLRRTKTTALDVFVGMLRLIYPNPGRHDDENPATQTEAEQAVSIAVTLVSLLRHGFLLRVDDLRGPTASP